MRVKQSLSLAIALISLLLTLDACGAASSARLSPTATGGSGVSCKTSQTIELDVSSFDSQCVTVMSNQPVTFDDPPYDATTATGGGHHLICIGEDTVCDTNPDVPKDLESPGFEIFPGQRHVVTFTKPGTYDITCPLHPMTMILIVK
jgi:plastocyanin